MTTKNPSNTPTKPAKWTWFELVGLILAFGLIGWPVLNFALGAVFPPNAQGQAAPALSLTMTASVSNAAPGEQFNYIFAIKASRSATLGRLTDVLPDELNYVNSFCVPPNCDRVNNSEYNVDKHTLSYSGTSTAFQAGDSVTLVLVVQLSKSATGSITNSAQVCDTNLVCASSSKVTVAVGGASPTPRPVATTAPVPTATSVPPTATAVPPTATAKPTATAVPSTSTPSAPPTATPIAAPTPTPAKPTATPAQAGSNGEAGTPSAEQGTSSAATATAQPPETLAATTAANTPTPVAGVIGGSFAAGAGTSALNGNRVDLVLRGGGSEKVVASSTVDGAGRYSFLNVKPTGAGEVYYVKYTNTTGSKTLRNWNTTSFPFGGGQANAPAADLSDITVGQPGAVGTDFALPLTLNWAKRADGDTYSITIFRADGTGVALASGSLGDAASYTLKNGSLPAGGYTAEINVSNASGAGVSQGHFVFRAGAVAAATTAAPTKAVPTNTPVPADPTKVPVPPGDKGEVNVAPTATTAATVASSGTGPGATTDTSTGTAPTSGTSPSTGSAVPTPSGSSGNAPTADASTGSTPGGIATDTPDLAPISLVIGQGVLAFVNGLDNGGSVAALPPATSSLPKSGGELPLAGLLLAAGVLGWRRFRLVARPQA